MRARELTSIPQRVGAAPVLLKAPVTITSSANGMTHVRDTIRKMSRLARAAQRTYEIRNLATRIVHDVPSKQVTRELFALYKWARDNIRYRFDPVDLEWVQSPERTVQEQAGDCDDITTLLAALIGALGHRWEFVTVGKTRNTQQHIAARAWNGKNWVTMDPVLEPPQETTAPRSDVGTFAMVAGGHSIGWNERGQQMGGYLGAPVTQRQRELWEFSPYYTNPAPHGGGELLPGVPVVQDPRYRSPNAPGFYAGAPVMLSFTPGAIESRYQHLADDLGRIPYHYRPDGLGSLGIWGTLKKIGKAVGKVAKVVKAIPGASSVVSMIPGGGAALEAASIVGKVSKVLPGGKKRRKKKKKRRGVKRVAKRRGVKRRSKRRKVVKRRAPAAGGQFPPNYVTRTDVRDLRKDIMNIARLSTRSDIEALVRAMRGDPPVPGFPKKDAFRKKRRKRRRRKKKVRARPSAKRFQRFDKKNRVFRIFKKKGRRKIVRRRGGMRGLGELLPPLLPPLLLPVLGPTMSFSLGRPSASDPRVIAAAAALARVERFVKKVGEPPALRLAEVKSFQVADGLLKADSLYGNNVRAALSWYLGKPIAQLPKPRWTNPVTWVSPDKRPGAVVAPAPPPVVEPALPPPVVAPPPPPPPVVVVKPPPPPPPVVVVKPPPPAPPPVVIVKPPPPAPPPVVVVKPPVIIAKPKALPPVDVPGFKQVATSITDPGLPGLPKAPTAPLRPVPSSTPTPSRTVITSQPTAPPKDKPRLATPQDVVAVAKATGKPVPTLRQATQIVAVEQAKGTPVVLPPLTQRVAAGMPPVPSDKAVVAVAPSPAFPAPPVEPGGEPSRPAPKSGGTSGDNTFLWLGLAYLYSRRKSA